jgi:hypothetical protein
MISERKFANGFASFWRGVLPMSEAYTRQMNLRATRFAPPMTLEFEATRSAIISELGFRLFKHFREKIMTMKGMADPGPIELRLADETWKYVRELIGTPRGILPPTVLDFHAAHELARRLTSFFLFEGKPDIVYSPMFLGCGIIDTCYGDVLCGNDLYEVKNVERHFRSVDLRQVLVYCALADAAGTPQLHSVSLVNARLGTYFQAELDELAIEVAGVGRTELLSRIVWFLSSEQLSR